MATCTECGSLAGQNAQTSQPSYSGSYARFTTYSDGTFIANQLGRKVNFIT